MHCNMERIDTQLKIRFLPDTETGLQNLYHHLLGHIDDDATKTFVTDIIKLIESKSLSWEIFGSEMS